MKLIKATTQGDIVSCMLIRTIVFMHEQHVDPLLEIDEDDKHCEHYLVKYKDKDVACARILKHDTYWQVGRIAVLKEYRKHHFGSFLLEEITKLANKENVNKLILGAQKQAVPFYEKNGYSVCGAMYMDANIEHYPMEKFL